MIGPSLTPTAELFGQLFLRELDAVMLAGLRQPAVAEALAAVGIELPEDSELEPLAAEYFELFLHPKHGAPPTESLWVDGQYEGDATIALRKIAEAAGCTFDRAAASGAAVDHVGSVLLLWAACVEKDPELAQLLAAEHTSWIPRALHEATARAGFYGTLCRATVRLVHEIRGD